MADETKTPTPAETIAAAVEREDNRPSAAERIEASRETLEAEREALREPADIGAAPATHFEASGAVQENDAKKQIDVKHPAVDNNPRAGTTEVQNRIDFNDPTLNDRQAVEQRLSEQDGDQG